MPEDLQQLRANNLARMKALEMKGARLSGIPEMWKQRMLEYLCGDALSELEITFEHEIGDMISNAETQIARAKLLGQQSFPPERMN